MHVRALPQWRDSQLNDRDVISLTVIELYDSLPSIDPVRARARMYVRFSRMFPARRFIELRREECIVDP